LMRGSRKSGKIPRGKKKAARQSEKSTGKKAGSKSMRECRSNYAGVLTNNQQGEEQGGLGAGKKAKKKGKLSFFPPGA